MRIKKFTNYITEAKNLHMEHLEDSLFNEGSAGVGEAIRFLESVADMLSGNAGSEFGVTVKWDGAPAIFAGVHPDTGKFFVSSKSLFNKNAKVNYTAADVDANHQGGLADKLKTALTYLPKIGIKGILQGDLMYTDDVSTTKIDGESHYTFQPNTIMYAVPVDSDLGNRIKASKMGVVWHTKYTGDSIESLSASFDPDVSKLKANKDVWFTDANFRDESGAATMTNTETTEMKRYIKNAKSLLNKKVAKVADAIVADSRLQLEIKTYINANVRNGTLQGSASGFISYIDTKLQKDVDKVKSSAAKERKEVVRKTLIEKLSRNTKEIDSLFRLHAALTSAKLIIIRKLESVKSIGTFVRTDDGFKVTAPEGFVAVDHTKNQALKLVDRLEFSRQNFNAAKNWVSG